MKFRFVVLLSTLLLAPLAVLGQSTDPAYNLWLADNDDSMIPNADASCWSTALAAEGTVSLTHAQWQLNGPSSALAGKVVRAIEDDALAWEPCAKNASTAFVQHLALYHVMRAFVAGDVFIHGTNGTALDDPKTCSGLQTVLNRTADETYIHNRLSILYSEEECR